ncbi:MAG: hypothetical protein WA405_08855 [Candidatus Acidiferrales bacterium]
MTDPNKNRTSHDKHDSSVYVHGAIEAHPPESLLKKHDTERKEDNATHVSERQEDRGRETKKLLLELLTLVAVTTYAGIAFWQGRLTRESIINNTRQFQIDERAWISVPFPVDFPSNGTLMQAVTKITNTGKTPARQVEANVIATVFNKGEEPALGDFSVGHPHNHIFAGALFTNAPIPLTITVVRYGPTAAEPIVADETLRQDIADQKKFIIFYGKISYIDIFGIRRWTQFCTGSGGAFQGDALQKCIQYNDTDRN